MENKTSIIWKISDIELQKLFNTSNTLQQILSTLGFQAKSGATQKMLKDRAKISSIDLSIFQSNRKSHISNISSQLSKRKKSNQQVFVTNCKLNRNSDIKKRIIKDSLIPYCCEKCSNNGNWNNTKLSLQLDHKNGDPSDNRLQNLRFLCPNCHSQTQTFSGKSHRLNPLCKICKINQTGRSQSGRLRKICKCCESANKKIPKQSSRKFNPTKEELYDVLVQNQWNLSETGRFYNVSDNSIKKRCKLFNLTKLSGSKGI